jgi:hypothetical protein
VKVCGGVEVDTASELGADERTASRTDHFAPGQKFPIQVEQGLGGPQGRSGRFGNCRNSNCGPSIVPPGFIIVTELSLLVACMGETRN